MRIRDVLLKAAKAEDLQLLFIQLRYCFYMNICLDYLVDIYIHIHTHTYIYKSVLECIFAPFI